MTTTKKQKTSLVLAIDPISRGFGYTLMEGPKELLDWGVVEVRINKNARCRKRIDRLLEFYKPEVLIVEDVRHPSSRRCGRVRRLIQEIKTVATRHGTRVCSYSPQEIKDLFARFDAVTKYDIACSITEWLPELQMKRPPLRKAWMSEDPRMSIFDATAMVLAYFFFEKY